METDSANLFGNRITLIEFFRAVNECNMPMVVTTHDYTNPTVLMTNAAHEKLTGYTNAELIGQNPRIFQGSETNRDVIRILKYRLNHYDYWEGLVTNYDKENHSYKIHLLIFGVELIDHDKFFVAIKKKV